MHAKLLPGVISSGCRPANWLVSILLGVGMLAGGLPTIAAELSDHAHSLKVVPDDASFYVAMLKNRQQIVEMTQTNAWKKLINIPIVSMGINQVATQWEFPQDERLLQLRDWIQGPEGSAILGLLGDAGSQEVVFYGDQRFATVLELLMEFNSEMNVAQAEMLRNMEDFDSDAQAGLNARMQAFLEAHSDEFDVPTFVLAGRISDQEGAQQVIDIVEGYLKDVPPLEGINLPEKMSRETTGSVDLVTITLTGDMLPWESLELEMEGSAELYSLIREIVYDKQLVLAIGRVDEFFVISIGPGIEHFTESPSSGLLVDTDRFQRLAAHADQELTSLGYFGGDMMKTLSSNERSLRDMAVTFKGLLYLSDLDPLRREAIEKDIDELTAELIAYLPDASTITFASFMTDRGYESISYNWAKLSPTVDGSKPLTLIDHVGDDSLAWFVSRGKQSVEGYNHFTSWLTRIQVHLEAIAQTSTSVEDWERYEQVRREFAPLLKRLDQANREQFLPAGSDGQGAVVLDASPRDTAWCEHMPKASSELPLPNLALVYGINDREQVKRGAFEYFSVAQQALDIAHRLNPDEVQPLTLPRPNSMNVSGGEIFAYHLPTAWGGSERIAPNAALGENVLVLSLLPEVSEKLLLESRPQLDGPLGKLDRPLLSASHIETAKLIDVLKPWIDYGVQVAIQKQQEQGQAQQALAMVGFVKPQIHEILNVMKVFHSSTAISYVEDDVVIRHSETRIVDLED